MKNLQEAFFEAIKERLPVGEPIGNVVADVLSVSTDSAYRRLRGETALTIDEVKKLVLHFGLSADDFFAANASTVSFDYSEPDKQGFGAYLKQMRTSLLTISDAKEARIVYAAKDIPLFQLFNFPELAWFKFFFWRKTIAGEGTLRGKKFTLATIDKDIIKTGTELLDLYVRIPSVEIWNQESITSLIKQVQFYNETGEFENSGDAVELLNKLEELVTHLQYQAELGFKCRLGANPVERPDNYGFYVNEFTLVDNLIWVAADERRKVYLVHGVFSYLATENGTFAQAMHNRLDSLIKYSTQVSSFSAKQRNQFFNSLLQQVDKARRAIAG